MFMIIAMDEVQKRLEELPPTPKEEILREMNGDYSQAVGMTPEQKKAAKKRWAMKSELSGVAGGFCCIVY
jgi:hypothetical protein